MVLFTDLQISCVNPPESDMKSYIPTVLSSPLHPDAQKFTTYMVINISILYVNILSTTIFILIILLIIIIVTSIVITIMII